MNARITKKISLKWLRLAEIPASERTDAQRDEIKRLALKLLRPYDPLKDQTAAGLALAALITKHKRKGTGNETA